MLQGQAKAKKEENVRMLHFTFSFHERIISPSLIFYQRRCNFRFFLRMKTPTTTLSLFSKEKKILNISKDVFRCSSCIAPGNLLKKLRWQRQVFMSKIFGLKPAESEGVSRNESRQFHFRMKKVFSSRKISEKF